MSNTKLICTLIRTLAVAGAISARYPVLGLADGSGCTEAPRTIQCNACACVPEPGACICEPGESCGDNCGADCCLPS